MLKAERVYSARKVEMLRRIEAYARGSPVIAVSKIRKVRARQIMTLKKAFRGDVKILVAKNKIASMGLRNTGLKGIDGFIQNLSDQNALIFTELNPFKLQLIMAKSKVEMPARAGDLATDDIVIPAGNTGMPPGPVLSEFKEAGVSTKIDTGSIWVAKDTVVARAGAAITPRLAGLLARLSLKPIKAGISIASAYMDGTVFRGEDLLLNLEEYRGLVEEAYRSVFTLSLEAGYPVKETAPLVITRAILHATSLALAAGYVTEENVALLLSSAEQKALTLLGLARQKGYSHS